MRSFTLSVSALLATTFLAACGGGDGGKTFGQSAGGSTSGGGASSQGGGTGTGGSGIGGTNPNAGGVTSVGGAAVGGAAGSPGAGGAGNVCVGRGQTLANSACYVGCQYDGAAPPRYDATGVCTKFGWKCSVLQYCNPLIHCQVDATCQQYGGPGWLCVPTPTGPLVGECAIRCETDADCPANTMTASPYRCNPVDNGTTVVKLCRF